MEENSYLIIVPDVIPNNWFTYWIASDIFDAREVILTADVCFVFSQHQQTEKIAINHQRKTIRTVVFTGLVKQYP